jgi:REP element-mobilizing transposase RayT
MKQHLKFPPARFDAACRDSIARGFAQACAEFGSAIHACAIGFDHVHLVTARSSNRPIEQAVAVLKSRATRQMTQDGTHPLRNHHHRGTTPTPWSQSCWTVFIDDPQRWTFIPSFE